MPVRFVLSRLHRIDAGRYEVVVLRDAEVLRYVFTVDFHDPLYVINSNPPHHPDFAADAGALRALNRAVGSFHQGGALTLPLELGRPETDLGELVRLLRAEDQGELDVDWPPLWLELETSCEHPFPPDFKLLIERLPPGIFGMVHVHHPLYWTGTPSERLELYSSTISMLHEALNWRTADREPPFPYRFGTSPGQLCVWGDVNSEVFLCWQITDQDPGTWHTVACTDLGDAWDVHPGSTTELLAALARGEMPVTPLAYLGDLLPFTYSPIPEH